MSRIQHFIAVGLAALVLALVAANLTLASLNRDLQADVTLRQQYVQQSVQLEGLYREIVRALAELGARNNDDAVRGLLARHGISYAVTPTAAAPAASPAVRK